MATELAASAEPGDECDFHAARSGPDAGTSDPGTAANSSDRALELAPRKHRCAGRWSAEILSPHAAGRSDEAKAFADTYLQEGLLTTDEAEAAEHREHVRPSPDVRADASRRALMLSDLSTKDRVRHLARLADNLIQAGRPEEARSTLADARERSPPGRRDRLVDPDARRRGSP